ncbi:1-acyl-sn-glycerol-3-phosphate acyltransferase [Candidatus Parcubacteria bacterium]|nr:1-acyl-sn-glycerol-3-phosphate acyltransferase [Candidatus Parcubacteria bacterium]
MSIGSQKHHSIEYIQIFLQFIIGLVVLTFVKIFFRFKVEGAKEVVEKLKHHKENERGIIFAPNHISEYDVLVMRYALPLLRLPLMPMYYVSMTKDHYQVDRFGWRKRFYGGTLFKLLGAYPAYVGMRDYQASLINHVELLENGKAVCIFPEGKMGLETFRSGEVKGGIGFLAEHTGSHIIPVRLKGLRNINWGHVFTFRRPTIEVSYKDLLHIHDLLDSLKTQEEYADDTVRYKKIASITMDKIWE